VDTRLFLLVGQIPQYPPTWNDVDQVSFSRWPTQSCQRLSLYAYYRQQCLPDNTRWTQYWPLYLSAKKRGPYKCRLLNLSFFIRFPNFLLATAATKWFFTLLISLLCITLFRRWQKRSSTWIRGKFFLSGTRKTTLVTELQQRKVEAGCLRCFSPVQGSPVGCISCALIPFNIGSCSEWTHTFHETSSWWSGVASTGDRKRLRLILTAYVPIKIYLFVLIFWELLTVTSTFRPTEWLP
jgi:hypothetical protein